MGDPRDVVGGPQEIYLDNNATTRPLPEVVDAVTRAMVEGYGNASSVHEAGRRARGCLTRARDQVSGMLNAGLDDVVFTSGATEANNLVLQSLLTDKLRGYRLVTTSVEHSSVLAAAEYLRTQGANVVILEPNQRGLVQTQQLVGAIEPGRTLVSIQWANNETGVIQPIPALADAARGAGALFHSDAVQAVGKVPIDLQRIPLDFLSLSAHKVHGPLGVGALVGPGVHQLYPLAFGGSQERALRPGTENVPAIVGLGVALETRAQRFERAAELTRSFRDTFERLLGAGGLAVSFNGSGAPRLPNTSNVRFSAIDGEALPIRLDRMGVRCSQSSACTNRRPEPSYVLRAMGLSEAEAYASVRFGFSELNTAEEVEHAVERITAAHAELARFAVA